MRAIVTVIGKDKAGIIAEVSTVLANNKINIEDISQTIVSDFFTMVMLCDFSKSKVTIEEIKQELNRVGDRIGVSIHIQHEDIFNAMHNV